MKQKNGMNKNVINRWHVLQIKCSGFVCCSFWVFASSNLIYERRQYEFSSQIVWYSSDGKKIKKLNENMLVSSKYCIHTVLIINHVHRIFWKARDFQNTLILNPWFCDHPNRIQLIPIYICNSYRVISRAQLVCASSVSNLTGQRRSTEIIFSPTHHNSQTSGHTGSSLDFNNESQISTSHTFTEKPLKKSCRRIVPRNRPISSGDGVH